MKFITLSLLALLLASSSFAREKQSFQAQRVQDAPRIDGDLTDPVWKQSSEKIQFHQFAPNNGSPSDFYSSVEILYTDHAIYIGARLHDPEPNKILKEFGKRDDVDRNADWFAFMVDPYNGGINAFTFFVSAAGVQGDFYVTVEDFDENWDAVWSSAVKIDEQGWIVEMAIPYFALRFPKQNVQTWGLNFYRNVKRKQEESYWNYVDNGVTGIVNQQGILHGLENIEPPLRLSFSPYVSAIYNHDGHAGKGNFTMAGGMDLKYGINESYTLDMSLIPDFSQVQSDNIVYNISPFEVQFNENRQFFTEGTDLFNKSGLFYSRRIGQSFGDAQYDETTEEITATPNAANLINATKISGRNKKGLGLGFFNALTNKSYATIRNIATGETREALVDPLTNFNVFVVDQNLKNNSNINFTNTNVIRADGGRDANTTGVNTVLREKTNTYQVSAFAAVSNVIEKTENGYQNNNGYKYYIEFAKISGKWQYGLMRNVESDDYNPNDLGYLQAPNEVSHFGYIRYSILKPKGIINFMNNTLNLTHQYLYNPSAFTSFRTNINHYTQFTNFWGAGFNAGVVPVTGYDYFEPRTTGRYFSQPQSYNYNIFVESDNRKALAGNAYAGRWFRNVWDQSFNWWGYYLRYRVNNKLSFDLEVNYEIGDSRGYVNDQPDMGFIMFGERELATTVNLLGFNYTFNTKMGVRLRVRHYWNTLRYKEFYELAENGDLLAIAYNGQENGVPQHDANFNALNVDLVYFWQVAPGSFVNIVWKDSIQGDNNNTSLTYFSNLENVSRQPQLNSLSVRLTYFLDYLTVKKGISRS
ncbi:MAG: hypothetical protein EBU52_05320 [Cytophagia bacterium]|nr:hypothetical protein [Cytophagia bacterium]